MAYIPLSYPWCCDVSWGGAARAADLRQHMYRATPTAIAIRIPSAAPIPFWKKYYIVDFVIVFDFHYSSTVKFEEELKQRHMKELYMI